VSQHSTDQRSIDAHAPLTGNAHSQIQISKENLKFSAAHFTIFSATERENLHGHNFKIALDMHAGVGPGGLTFDYNILKTALKNLCDRFDEKTLMPEHSPHLSVEHTDDYVVFVFNGERIPFLPRDVMLLPVRNITVEELSNYLLGQLEQQLDFVALDISSLTLKCSSGEGQWE